jgi:ATP-dependent DNA helicase RecG
LSLSQSARAVLFAIAENAHITTAQLTSQLGKSDATVERALKLLQETGHLCREGSRKTGHWVVLKK